MWQNLISDLVGFGVMVLFKVSVCGSISMCMCAWAVPHLNSCVTLSHRTLSVCFEIALYSLIVVCLLPGLEKSKKKRGGGVIGQVALIGKKEDKM